VRGVVTDDSEKIAAVTVNGQAVTLSADTTGTRGLGLDAAGGSRGFAFERATTSRPILGSGRRSERRGGQSRAADDRCGSAKRWRRHSQRPEVAVIVGVPPRVTSMPTTG